MNTPEYLLGQLSSHVIFSFSRPSATAPNLVGRGHHFVQDVPSGLFHLAARLSAEDLHYGLPFSFSFCSPSHFLYSSCPFLDFKNTLISYSYLPSLVRPAVNPPKAAVSTPTFGRHHPIIPSESSTLSVLVF